MKFWMKLSCELQIDETGEPAPLGVGEGLGFECGREVAEPAGADRFECGEGALVAATGEEPEREVENDLGPVLDCRAALAQVKMRRTFAIEQVGRTLEMDERSSGVSF